MNTARCLALLAALGAVVACGPPQSRASTVTGKTYCGGIMDPDLGDRLAASKDEKALFYAVVDFSSDRPMSTGAIYTGVGGCSGSMCFAHATKEQLFKMCGWVGVRQISSWNP